MLTNKRTNEEWRALLAEQRASGQPQAEWCAANGVNQYTLRDRASRLKKMDRVPDSEPELEQTETASTGWVEIKPDVLLGAAGIRVEHGGFVVTVNAGFDAELLVDVLRTVSRACC